MPADNFNSHKSCLYFFFCPIMLQGWGDSDVSHLRGESHFSHSSGARTDAPVLRTMLLCGVAGNRK